MTCSLRVNFIALKFSEEINVTAHRNDIVSWKSADRPHSALKRTLAGLPSHPQHELAVRQSSGFSGMVSFYIKGGLTESTNFLKSTKIIALASSLGGIESLSELP